MTVKISSDPYYNLLGAIEDLEYQGADEICIKTLKRVHGQIHDLQKVVELVKRGSRMAIPPDLADALDALDQPSVKGVSDD